MCRPDFFRASIVRLPAAVTFLISVIIGALISVGLHDYFSLSDSLYNIKLPHTVLYNAWLKSHDLVKVLEPQNHSLVLTEAKVLSGQVHVLCYVFIDVKRTSTLYSLMGWNDRPGLWRGALAISKTWGRRCNKLIFFSNSLRNKPHEIEVIAIDESPLTSWAALNSALRTLYSRYSDDYQWFVRIDIDSYLIVENLRYYLSVYNSSLDHYLGCTIQSWFSAPYNIYEGGIVLSQGALKILNGALARGQCGPKAIPGDKELGVCLRGLDVSISDTRDALGRGRFLPSDPEDLLIPQGSLTPSYWSPGAQHYLSKGPNCCSDYAISFHNVNPDWMLMLDYFVYAMKPYGKSVKRVKHSTDKL